MSQRVLVTGATGFVGRACLPFLHASGFEIHATASGSERLLPLENVRWHQCDLLDGLQVRNLFREVRPEYLLHAAWCPTIPGKFWQDRSNPLWVRASLQLLESFATFGGRRATLVGTCAEYDWGAGLCEEKSTPLLPATPYGKCKLSLSLAASELAASSNFSLAWGRLFFLYGPREHPQRLVASVIRALLDDQIAPCTHGRQQRDFLHIEDAASALVSLLLSDVTGAVNVASGEAVAIETVVKQIAEALKKPELLRLGAIESSSTEPTLLVADVTRLREEVVWSPKYTLQSGLQGTIAWWKENL